MKNFIFLTILGVSMAACEQSGNTQESTHAAVSEAPATHLGGCILLEPNRQSPDNLHAAGNVVATNEIAPFSKMLLVNGLTLAARDEISDEFMTLVARTIAEIFPQNPDLDLEMQARVIDNHYRYSALIPVPNGDDFSFMEDNQEQWAVLESQYSICDIIMQDVPGQVMEVIEHILHYVTDIGLHYAYPDVWGISEQSQLAAAMRKAVDMGYYDISSYDDIDDVEARNRVEMQEFAYWFVSTAWNLQADYGPVWEQEWTIRDRTELKEKLPEFFAAYEQTVDRVMVAPSLETLAMIGPTRAEEAQN